MPEFTKQIFFGFILVKNNLGHESHDDYVTVDNIEINQSTLFNLAPQNQANVMQMKQSRL